MENKITDKELAEIANGVISRLKELEISPNWIKNGDKPCEMYKMDIEQRVASRGIAVVNYPIHKIFEFLEKEDSLQKINPQLLQIKVLHAHEHDFRVNYMQYKGVWPVVSNRDFVNVSKKIIESDSKIYIGTKACSYPYPEQKGVVRGEVLIGGYIMEKIDEKSTRVTYISDADLKGSIPGMIKNTLSQQQGEVAAKIEKAMKKQNL